jgi:hypothetical protein
MKLRNGFITYTTGAEQIMVAAGTASDVFRGMVRSNATAAFIIDCLKEEISREELGEKLLARYDAPRDVILRDLDRILDSLRKIGALDE